MNKYLTFLLIINCANNNPSHPPIQRNALSDPTTDIETIEPQTSGYEIKALGGLTDLGISDDERIGSSLRLIYEKKGYLLAGHSYLIGDGSIIVEDIGNATITVNNQTIALNKEFKLAEGENRIEIVYPDGKDIILINNKIENINKKLIF